MRWKLILAIVATATVGVTANAVRYHSIFVHGPDISPALIGLDGSHWPAVPGMRLHVFNTGMNRVSGLLAGADTRWRPAPAFVIEHPAQGLIVFDAGLGPEIAEKGEGALPFIVGLLFKSRSRPGLGLAAQMRAQGLDPLAVRFVILSHLHFDHVGDAEAFRNATFVVGANARAIDRSPQEGFAPAHTDWIAANRWHEVDFERDGKPYATFDRVIDLFGDRSIMLVRGGGHATNDLAALLALPGGPALLAGDVIVHRDWLASDDVERIAADPARAAEMRNRVRALLVAAPATVLICGHDLRGVPSGRADILLHRPDLYSASAWNLWD